MGRIPLPLSAGHEGNVLTAPAGWSTSAGSDAAEAGDSRRWQEALTRFDDRFWREVRRGWRHYYYLRIKKRVADIVEPGARVLDIGCGDGELLSALRPSVGVGVDLNARSLDVGRHQHAGLRFLRMRGEDVDQVGEKFDYVILSQTLGEIYDLQAVFLAV